MALQEFFSSRNRAANVSTFVGQAGRMFYNEANGVMRISDGITPGGLPVPYTIASNTVIGGIKAGPGTIISNEGVLYIDTANLALSFGDFSANANTLTIVNNNENMVLKTKGNAEVQLVGNIAFYRANTSPLAPQFVDRYFHAQTDGQVTFVVANVDFYSGGVKIIGNNDELYVAPQNYGVMQHVTGQPNLPSRIYNDAIANYATYIGRRYNGNVSSPSQVKSGNIISRVGATPYTSGGWPANSTARINFVASQDQTLTALGNMTEFWNVANDSNTIVRSAYLTSNVLTVNGNISATHITSNVTGLLTQGYRNAGAQDGGTLTLDFSSDSIVKATYDNTTFTVAFSNYIAGRKVTLILTNTAGGGRTFNIGVPADQNTLHDASPSVAAGRVIMIDYYSVDGNVGGVFASVNYN